MRSTNRAAIEILDTYYAVHDHGFISLIDFMGDDEAIDRAARNSVGKVWDDRNDEQRAKLITRLMRDTHTSPFEMVELKFHCAMPIFVARQWIRHRTANINEYSGRYSQMPALFYTPIPENICHQNIKNKQGRGEVLHEHDSEKFLEEHNMVTDFTARAYKTWISRDISRELARIDLPLSTYTQWYWKIDLHNLFHFLTLRVDPAAQTEIRKYADIMAAIAQVVVPKAFDSWLKYILNSCRIAMVDWHADREECIQRLDNFEPRYVMPLGIYEIKDVKTIRDEWKV